MLDLPVLTDPGYVKPARYSAFDRAALRLIRDERDLPFVHLIAKITAILVPLSAALFLVPALSPLWWVIAVAHFGISTFKLKGPFGLMLHCVSHRPFFKPEHQNLNYYITWVLAPLFGQSPESYFSHHIGMHHPSNNEEDDESSTLGYQRDSLRGFAAYYLDFALFGVIRLSAYLKKKNRPKLLHRLWLGEACFYAMCVGLCFVNLPAVLAVFIVPYVVSRLIMMLGNWCQHAFISADDVGNPFQNSVTCLNTAYNHTCWNDGYHACHHRRPALHYTEYPAFFLKNLGTFTVEQAVVFSGIHYLHIFFWLMGKRYDKLAAHYVNLDGRFESDAEVIDFLKSRTARIAARPVAMAA